MRQLEIGRQHADHLVRLAVDADAPSDDGRVRREAARPQRVRQDDPAVGAGNRVGVEEGAAERGTAPERRKEGWGDGERHELLWRGSGQQRRCHAA